MSWYRRIKCLFTIQIVIFSYIVWSSLNFIVIRKHISTMTFFYLLISMFLMEYINYKKDNKWLSVGIPALIGLVVNALLYRSYISFTLNYAYLIFIIFYGYNLEKNYVNYYSSREMFKKSLIILVLLWMITMLFKGSNNKAFFRFYIMYFTIGIIYLREIRDYSYNVINKKSLVIDGITATLIFSLSIETFYKIFFKGLMLLKTAFEYIVDIVINMLMVVLDKPYTAILKFLKSLFKDRNSITFDFLNKKVVEKGTKEMVSYARGDMKFIRIIIRILIFAAICIVVYKIASKLIYYSSKEENADIISEKKEKIEIERKKKSFFNKVINSIYLGKDPKKKIKHIYKNIQAVSKEKEIFSEHMTATQLENSIIISRDVKRDDIEYITDKYNETKFSYHNISEEMAEEFRKNYTKIKKKI